jgi:hypothetical protein
MRRDRPFGGPYQNAGVDPKRGPGGVRPRGTSSGADRSLESVFCPLGTRATLPARDRRLA